MTTTGKLITISIGGTPYATKISEYSENGGKKLYDYRKTFGNNVKKVFYGWEDIELELKFRLESTELNTLYENTSETTIVIVIGTEQTLTYYNMLPTNVVYDLLPDSLAEGKITYTAPGYDIDNTRTNRQVS